MRRFSLRAYVTGLLVGVVCLTLAAGRSRAGAHPPETIPRPAAFTFQCFTPTTDGYHTRASLVGKITLEHRIVWMEAWCADNVYPGLWPEFDWADGAVQSVELYVRATLEDSQHQVVRDIPCVFFTGSGFFSGRCKADEELGGQVNMLVTIVPMNQQP